MDSSFDNPENMTLSMEDMTYANMSNITTSQNSTQATRHLLADEYYIHARNDFKVLLIILYTTVFVTCFIGNSLVVAVVICQRRMRSATNLFLTNLAIADLMVAFFCVYQNLSLWILQYEWAFGPVMCKTYHFIHALAYTASVFIMVLVGLERYVAIMYPMAAKRWLRMSILRYVITVVWLLSAAICAPRLWMYGMVMIPSGMGTVEPICILKLREYDPRPYNIMNFSVLFVMPVLVMLFVYVRLAIRLYSRKIEGMVAMTRINKKSNNERQESNMSPTSAMSSSNDESSKPGCLGRTMVAMKQTLSRSSSRAPSAAAESHMSTVVTARRKVIRLLIVVVAAFVICHFPNHLRKLLQDWYPNYRSGTNASILFTIFTNLLMYANSSCNPILYALMSKKFRTSMADVMKIAKTACVSKRANMEIFANGHVRPKGKSESANTMKTPNGSVNICSVKVHRNSYGHCSV